jgi:glycosyltransferase involved in cell wall biosynthesis
MPDSPGRAPRVLIVAPNASSIFGGESFLPLQYFRILRRRGYPVRLVTHSRNRPDLEATLGPDLGAVSFVEDTAAHRLVWRIGSRFPAVIREVVFDRALDALDAMYLSGIIRRLVAAGHVDLIHQPTPVSPLAPSGLHRFGVPLVLGPMNGGMNYPPGYDDLESPRARRFVGWSRRLAWLLNRLTPGKRRAAVLLVANERTRAALPFPHHPDIRVLVENGVDLATWGAGRPGSSRGPDAPAGRLRLVFMGRLIPLKMVDLTLEAVRAAREGGAKVTFDVMGDGPERPRLERLAQDWGLEGTVRFHGFLPQAACARRMTEADALILASVRECGGAVVLEAMAAGLPVIASDWGGPADYLDESCGILVSPVPRDSFAARQAEAILRLARDPALRRRMGEAGARKIVEQFDWERKVDRMISIYAEVATAHSPSKSPGPVVPGAAVAERDAG